MPGPTNGFVAARGQLEDGTPVVSVIGEVDLATAPAFEQSLRDVAGDRSGAAIVDLTGCGFLDSKGLAALLATREQFKRSERRLALVLSNPGVMRIFQITGYDELFEIHHSLIAAAMQNGEMNR